MVIDPNTVPVIVGVGEITDRPADPALGLEPAALAIPYGRDGKAGAGTAVLRLPDGARTLARVDPGDQETMSVLQSGTRSPVGAMGRVRSGSDDLAFWSAMTG